jgi:hypothetical protein
MRKPFYIFYALFNIVILIAFSNCSNSPAKTESTTQKVKEKVVVNVYEKQGNIYVTFEDGSEKQLSKLNADSDPFLLTKQNAIVCVRKKEELPGGYSTHKIMLLSIGSGTEKTLAENKPFKDEVAGTTELITVETPKISELVKINLNTGKWTELFLAENFELLNFDPYKGMFLAGQSDDLDRGPDIYYRVLVEDGRVVKDLNTYEEAKAFLQNYGVQSKLETNF